MGAFQSVGGAATSGKGFKGDQITSGIIAALIDADHSDVETRRQRRQQQHYQRPRPFQHRDVEGGVAGSEGASPLSFGGDGGPPPPPPLPTELLKPLDYVKETVTKCPYISSEKNTVTSIEVTEYAPDAFYLLRELGGTDDGTFIDEWDTFPKATRTVMEAKRGGRGGAKYNRREEEEAAEEGAGGGLELGEGRSMALFLKSKSMAFMCKTISETEVDVLVSILPKYLKHIEQNPDSMLMRFVMLLKVTVDTTTYAGGGGGGQQRPHMPLTDKDFSGQKVVSRESEVGYVLVFNDCFSNCDVLHERWDLKGRHPKPGKFRHFPNHQLFRNRVVQPKHLKQRAAEQHSIFDDINDGAGTYQQQHYNYDNDSEMLGPNDRRRNQGGHQMNSTERREHNHFHHEREEHSNANGDSHHLPRHGRSTYNVGGGNNDNYRRRNVTGEEFSDLDDEQRQQADLSSDEEGGDGERNLRADKTLDTMRLNTRKDKDLARLFWLEPADRQYLIQQITADFKFLLDCGLMDYSILIGVRYNTPEEQYEKEQRRTNNLSHPSSLRSIGGATPPGSANFGSGRNGDLLSANNNLRPSRSSLGAMKMPFVMGEENAAGIIEVRPSSPNAQVKRGGGAGSGHFAGGGHSASAVPNNALNGDVFDEFHSQFHQGVDSIECVETYYIGIIDMLTVFNFKKKIANTCKKCLWRENTLSTIPPNRYAERIEKYAHRIFPRVAIAECNDGTLLPQKQCLLIGRGKVSTHAAGFKVARNYLTDAKNQNEFLVAPERK